MQRYICRTTERLTNKWAETEQFCLRKKKGGGGLWKVGANKREYDHFV